MNRKAWLTGVGLVGIVLVQSSCGGGGGGGTTRQPVQNGAVEPATKAELKALRDSLETLLGKQGTDPETSLHQWLKDLATGVCQLENKAPPGWALDDAKRFCKTGGPIDKTSPPPFPPR